MKRILLFTTLILWVIVTHGQKITYKSVYVYKPISKMDSVIKEVTKSSSTPMSTYVLDLIKVKNRLLLTFNEADIKENTIYVSPNPYLKKTQLGCYKFGKHKLIIFSNGYINSLFNKTLEVEPFIFSIEKPKLYKPEFHAMTSYIYENGKFEITDLAAH